MGSHVHADPRPSDPQGTRSARGWLRGLQHQGMLGLPRCNRHGQRGQPAPDRPNQHQGIFTSPGSQVAWVALGSSGFSNAGLTTYGDGDIKKPVAGGMPAWGDSLTADELMDVVLHERTTIDEEEFDIEKWKTNFEEDLAAAKIPADKAAEYVAVLEAWEANPPA